MECARSILDHRSLSIGRIRNMRVRTKISEDMEKYLPRICLSRCALAATGSIEGQRCIDLGFVTGDPRLKESSGVGPRGSE